MQNNRDSSISLRSRSSEGVSLTLLPCRSSHFLVIYYISLLSPQKHTPDKDGGTGGGPTANKDEWTSRHVTSLRCINALEGGEGGGGERKRFASPAQQNRLMNCSPSFCACVRICVASSTMRTARQGGGREGGRREEKKMCTPLRRLAVPSNYSAWFSFRAAFPFSLSQPEREGERKEKERERYFLGKKDVYESGEKAERKQNTATLPLPAYFFVPER